MKFTLRAIIGVILGAIVVVALVPLFVLVDLNDGGNGWGLCEGVVGDCRTSYFDGVELLALLMAVAFGLLAVLRFAVVLLRRIDRHDDRNNGALQG